MIEWSIFFRLQCVVRNATDATVYSTTEYTFSQSLVPSWKPTHIRALCGRAGGRRTNAPSKPTKNIRITSEAGQKSSVMFNLFPPARPPRLKRGAERGAPRGAALLLLLLLLQGSVGENSSHSVGESPAVAVLGRGIRRGRGFLGEALSNLEEERCKNVGKFCSLIN